MKNITSFLKHYKINDVFNIVDKKLSKKIIKIFKDYDFNDLCFAIFCLNIYRYNRPFLNFNQTLNYSLSLDETFGSKKISSYEDFVSLYENINSLFNPYDYNIDPIVPDLGEVKIFFNDKFYSVLIGNGYNFMFPFYLSLSVLADVLNIKDELTKLLDFYSDFLNKFSNIEEYNESNYNLKNYQLPSENFFNHCKRNYYTVKYTPNIILDCLISNNNKNFNQCHFIKKDNYLYPIFNSSFLYDCFYYICKYKFDNKINTFNYDFLIEDALYKNFPQELLNQNIFLNCAITYDKKEIFHYDFVLLNDNDFLFILNETNIYDYPINIKIENTINLLKNKKLYLIFDTSNGHAYKIELNNSTSFNFIVFNNSKFVTNINSNKFNNYKRLSIYDLIYLIYISDDFEQIIKFFKEYKKDNIFSFNCFDGFSSDFLIWKNNLNTFNHGAEIYNSFVLECYNLDKNIFNKFLNLNTWYPFSTNMQLFSNPLAWNFQFDNFQKIYKLNSYQFPNFDCSIKKIKNSFLILAYNLSMFNSNTISKQLNDLTFIDNLVLQNFNLLETVLIDSNFYIFKGIYILFMPFEYVLTHNQKELIKNNSYVHSAASLIDQVLHIKYTINIDKFFEDFNNSNDKSIECIFMKEFFKCLDNFNYINLPLIFNKIDSFQKDHKDFSLIPMELPFYFSLNNEGIIIKDSQYFDVKNKISYFCKKAKILPGTYNKKDANQIIRNIQKTIIPYFESFISKFDKLSLHIKLISILSSFIFKNYTNDERLQNFENNNIDFDFKSYFKDNTIKNRENNKHFIYEIEYAIDTNLSINHNNSNIPSFEDLQYIIAFSNWLIILQNCSDETNYNLFGSSLTIQDDFTIFTNYSETQSKKLQDRQNRKYNHPNYSPKFDNFDNYVIQINDAFYKDTNVYLKIVFSICSILYSNNFYYDYSNKYQIDNDVFKIKYNDLLYYLINDFSENDIINLENVKNALNYLSIDTTKIKTLDNDKECDFVPIWERKNRLNRIEIKPIYIQNDYIYYSPIMLYRLYNIWYSAIYNFFPPIKYGLNNFIKVQEIEKHKFEKKMEKDIASLFTEHNIFCKNSVLINKINKQFNYPLNLGDYDVIAIDNKNKIIWNIESKFFEFIGSYKELYNHESAVFKKNGDADKFQNRINFLENNIQQILTDFHFIYDSDYKILNYMVTNKLYLCDVSSINFEIITFYELKDLINSYKY